ncbi:MAG: nucleotide-diphospho-sugar transferase [bacterium]
MNNNFPIPILLIAFNRPDTTRQVFETIRKIKPERFFFAVDGPRKNRAGEEKNCLEVQEIIKQIDWDCEVKTLFRKENLGCKMGVSSAINWFFENVDEGIILEDDCVPDQSFFSFCEKMLEKYRNNQEIMHINGTNSQFGEKFGLYSYYFSHCPQVWGWATWKRVWNKYDIEMTDLEQFIKTKKTLSLFKNKKVANFWNDLFKYAKKTNINTWDIQWSYSVMNFSGLAITPNVNLVENIGFGTNSTHTSEINTKLRQKADSLLKIEDPQEIKVEIEADYKLFKKIYFRSVFTKIKSKILSQFKKNG